MKGKIRVLKGDKAFGFIQGEDAKDYFFHRSALRNAQFDDLEVGQAVEFKPTNGDKGPRAEDVNV